MAIYRRDPPPPPLLEASNTAGADTSRDSGRIAGYRSTTAAARDQQLTVFRAVVYDSYGACLFTAQIDTHQ